ncbi:MAG: polysaccharide deacetylase family protein [Bacteroidetes bacterium]|nr:polysaccharide deacetylase family protein [Bacteroidota bacterium]
MNFLKKDRYLIRSPWWMKKLFSFCIWDMPIKENILYLTFDDGPHAAITPIVLDTLKKYDAKATFFCIGNNVTNNPEVFQRIHKEGHAVGNHTYHHLNGWKTSTDEYLKDIAAADTLINSKLFRPPYGRIKKAQAKQLQREGHVAHIVMWNILAGDWDISISPEKCYTRIKNKISAGDIIVLHDSEKAKDRMYYCLTNLLKDFSEKGFRFEAIKFS